MEYEEKYIRDRADHVLGVIAPVAGTFNDVLDPLVDMLARAQRPPFNELKGMAQHNPAMAKLDILESVALRIAKAEPPGNPYTDKQLLDKVRGDLEVLAQSVSETQRNPGGRTH